MPMDQKTADTIDLIARLRNPVGLVTENIMRLNNEAADEIERLTVLAGEKECPKCGGSGWIRNLQTLSPSDDEPCNYCRSR